MKSILLVLTLFFSQLAAAQAPPILGRIITDFGTIGFKLNMTKPATVENFVQLAKGEKKYIDIDGKKGTKPYYNGQIFYRAHPDLGIFTGCPYGTGRGFPGYMFPEEYPQDSKFDRPGLMAMAKPKGSNQVGSQFFITTKAMPYLTGRYVVFGEVTSGLDVVERIARTPIDATMKPKKEVHVKTIEFD